jgi:hypothetical protein
MAFKGEIDDLWGSDDDNLLPSAASKKSDDGRDDVWGSDGSDDEATQRHAAAKRDEKNMRAKHYKVDARTLVSCHRKSWLGIFSKKTRAFLV